MLRPPLILLLAALSLSACRDDGISKPIHSVPTPRATPTPTPDVTPTPDPNATPTTDGSGGTDTTGATMATADESISVVSIDSTNVTDSTLTIERSNGEVWEFDVPGIPSVTTGATITYQNTALVFGSISGAIIFADGTTAQITATARIQ